MNKYIDRAALFNSLSDAKTVEEIFAAIQAAPAEDVEPVRRGRWIKMSDADGYYYDCSECGETLHREPSFDREFDLFPRKRSINRTNYCPNCGAKMEDW